MSWCPDFEFRGTQAIAPEICCDADVLARGITAWGGAEGWIINSVRAPTKRTVFQQDCPNHLGIC